MTRACRDCKNVEFMESEGRPGYGDHARCKFFDSIVPLGDCCPKWEPWCEPGHEGDAAILAAARKERDERERGGR